MKKLLSIVAVIAIAATAFSADVVRFGGANGNPYTVVGGGSGGWTNSIAAAATATNATQVFLPQQTALGQVAVQVNGIGTSSSTTNFTIVTLQQSVDGVNWVALGTVTNLASSTVSTVTVGAVPYIRVYSIKNSDAGALTNYSVVICPK